MNWGTIIQVGPGRFDENGKNVPLAVKVGDQVLLPEWGGSEVTLSGDNKLHIYRDDDIVGVLSEKVV